MLESWKGSDLNELCSRPSMIKSLMVIDSKCISRTIYDPSTTCSTSRDINNF